MIGERLRRLRQDAGFTQQELADQLSISIHTIRSYEQGKSEPDDSLKIKIANTFHVSLDYLVGLTNNVSKINDSKSCIILIENISDSALNELKQCIKAIKDKYHC